MSQSEIAKLREQITLEYRAAKRVFTDFTLTARHEFITKRQENIAGYFFQLKEYVGEDDAMLMVIQVENEVDSQGVIA